MTDSRLAESWTWFAFASLTFVWRYISRAIHLGGWRYLELEDYMMVLTFGFYTAIIVLVNVQAEHPYTNILPPTGTAGMTAAEIDDRIYGAKITFTLEESMIMTQWGCKICMCLLYYKLTEGLSQHLHVKILIGYVALGWLVTEVFFFGIWCRPFLNYFRVFDGNDAQCTTSPKHLVMSFFFNVSSDILMLCIPVPLLLKSKLPWKQKTIITGIFSLGGFVIISASLNRYYCFAHPESILWIFWYVREASTAIMVTNIPHCYALLRKIFNIGSFDNLTNASRPTFVQTHTSKSDPNSTELNRIHQGKNGVRIDDGKSESTENFAKKDGLNIWQQNEFSVTEHDANEIRWDDDEMKSIRRGRIGTKSTVVGNTAVREHGKGHDHV